MHHVVFLVTRKDGMTQEQFTDYWINQHCPLTAQLPGLRSYRCYPYTSGLLESGERPPFDAIAFIGFDDEQSARTALASDEFRTAVADGVNFQDVSNTFGYAAMEYVIV